MVTQTPRFDLNKYSQGEDNWSHSDTIDFVDEYSIDKGPVADRPTTGDYDDQLYFATDQGLFWRWDSNVSDWTTDAFGTESNRVPDTSYFDGVDANSLSADVVSVKKGRGNGIETQASDGNVVIEVETNAADAGNTVAVWGGDELAGLVTCETGGFVGIFFCEAARGVATKTGGSSEWGDAAGDSKYNFYYDGSNYVIENNSASNVNDFNTWLIGSV